ncbi:MAG: shikimate dehydrogenase [Flavobacteriales bacterium]|nr:shikimate dehydrogenase [Flavobacteriales bacterium]
MMTYGLIGRPLGHSRSPALFADLFREEGLKDHRYEAFDLPEIASLADLLQQRPDIRGLNVTIPYKQAVIPLLDALDPTAAAVGAVNTIHIAEGRLTGHNTDVEGFRTTIAPYLKDLVPAGSGIKPRALVLGSGGASRAVAFVLREAGVRFRIVSRSRERGDLTWDLVDPTVVKVCPLIINTTPLGMAPDRDTLPDLPYEAIGPRHVLIDLVYEPERTRFLEEGELRGARTENGMAMLRAQAEAAWRIWKS